MTHFALLSPPYTGHLNPMRALAHGLIARGHAATLVAQSDVAPEVAGTRIGFRAVGAKSHPPGALERMTDRLAKTTGLFGIGGVIRDVARTTEMLCREGAPMMGAIGAEAILADQTEPAGGLLARYLGLPQISIANALLINREPSIPPPFIDWPYDASDWGLKRNRGGYRVADLLMRPVNGVIRRVAAEWHVVGLNSIEDCLSPTLQISQTMEGFDFLRSEAPPALRHVGPLRARDEKTFMPPDRRPLVFCSLGTLQGARFPIFETVARACVALDLSLVIAHGGKLTTEQVARLPGHPMVEAFVPQRAVMEHACAVVTHGGLNTVLDALTAGVPLIVVPLAFEQGAIAARVAHCGAGLVIPPRRLTSSRLEGALKSLRNEQSYRDGAHRLRQESRQAGGVERAVSLIEEAIAASPMSRR